MQATGKTIIGRAAADWLTVGTWEESAAQDVERQMRWREKKDPAKGKWLQYEGVKGEQFFSGWADQDGGKHYALWASGALADEVLPTTLEVNPLGDPMSAKVTRLDVQITLPDWERPTRLADLAQALERGDLGGWKRKGANPSVTFYGSSTGDTIYIGNRKSPRLCRIYQKEVGKERFLRVEMEYKGALARNLYKEYRALDGGTLGAVLAGEFATWPSGLCDYLRPFIDWSEGTLPLRPYAKRDPSPEWKRLEWLRKLAPTLKQMVRSQEIGKESWDILCDVLDPDAQA